MINECQNPNVKNNTITQIIQTIKKAWITQMIERLGETERKEVLKLRSWETGEISTLKRRLDEFN